VPGDAPGTLRLRALAERPSPEARLQLYTLGQEDETAPALGPEEDPFPAHLSWQALPADQLDALLADPGPYTWIGGRLGGDGRASPRVAQVQLVHAQEGYARHLPALYREDEAGGRLLDGLLALLESVQGGLQEQIVDLPLLYDPWAAPRGWAPWLGGWQGESGDRHLPPPDWLPWLASWLALELDETWSEAQTRAAITEAYALYGARGTAEGLRRTIKLYTGVEARIEEPVREQAVLWSLGQRSVLGFDTRLAPVHAQGAVLGTTGTLDESHLLGEGAQSAPLFEDLAHRFCVQVHRADLREPGALDRVSAVVEREKPAHSVAHVCVIEPRMRVGFQARVGIDTVVAGPPGGVVLGEDVPLGRETVLVPAEGERRGAVGETARVGRGTRLT
jgi:hypothetical protein